MSPIRSSIRNFFSGEITVGEDSWHYRFYKWWLAYGGGNRWNYRENLCHYMRVVLIWVPLFWFFGEPIIKWWVRPWMVVAVITAIAGLIIVYNVSQGAFWEMMVFLGIVLVLTTLSLIAGIITLYIKDNPENRWAKRADRVEIVLFWAVALTIGLPFTLLFLLNEWTEKRYYKNLIKWYFTQGMHKVIYPWTVTATVLIVLSLIFLGPWITLLIVVGITGMLVGIGILPLLIIIGLFFLSDKLRERRMRREFNRPYPSPSKSGPKGTSTLKIFTHAVMAKKRKICPFIKLPRTVSSNGGLYHNLPGYGE